MQTSCNYLHKVNLKFQKNRRYEDGTQAIEALCALFYLIKELRKRKHKRRSWENNLKGLKDKLSC